MTRKGHRDVGLSSHSPRLIHHGCLVEALLLQDFDGPLAGDGGQDGEWGRQVQALQLQVPPPSRWRADTAHILCRSFVNK